MDFIESAQDIYEQHPWVVIGAVVLVAAVIIMLFVHYMGWFKSKRVSGPLDNEEEFNVLIDSIHEKQKPRKK